MKVLIIIPAYNEGKNIRKVISNLQIVCPQYDYIIVNDGSNDDTVNICIKEKYNYIDLPVNLGIGGCVQTGYIYANEKGYDIVIQFDGDGQHEAKYINNLIKPIVDGYADVTIGSRFIEKEGFQSSRIRRIGIKFLSFIIKLCIKEKILDVTSGFRAANQKMVGIFAKDYAQDYPEPEAIIISKLNNTKIKEIPVVMNERHSGTSSIYAVRSLYYMIKVSLAVIIERLTYKKG